MKARTGLSILLLLFSIATIISGAAARHGGGRRSWHGHSPGRMWQPTAAAGRIWQGRRLQGTEDFKFGLSEAVGDYTDDAAPASAAAATAAPTNTPAAAPAAAAPGDSTPTGTANPQVGFQPPLTLSEPVGTDSTAQKSNTASEEEVKPQLDQEAKPQKAEPQVQTTDSAEETKQGDLAQVDGTSAKEAVSPADDTAGGKAAQPSAPTTPSRKLQSSGIWGNEYGGGWRGWYGGSGRSWQDSDWNNGRVWQGRRLQGAQATDSTASSESAQRWGMGGGGHAWGGGGGGMIWHGRRLQGTQGAEAAQRGGGGYSGPGNDWNTGSDINGRNWQWGPGFGDIWSNWGKRKLMSAKAADTAESGGYFGPESSFWPAGGASVRTWQQGSGPSWANRKLLGASSTSTASSTESAQRGGGFGGGGFGGGGGGEGGHFGPGADFNWGDANDRSWQQGYGPSWANRKLLETSSTESAQRGGGFGGGGFGGGGGGEGGHFGPGADFNWGDANDRSWQQGYGPSWAN